MHRKRNRRIDLIHHRSTTKLWRLCPWYSRLQPAENQVNLLLLLLQEQGDFLLASTPTGDEEPYDMRETLRSLVANWKSTSCAFCFPYYYTHTYIVATGRTDDKPTTVSIRTAVQTTTMEPLPHGQFGLDFQQAIDRQDRILQTEGRFSLLELLEIQPYQRNTPTTGQGLIARRR